MAKKKNKKQPEAEQMNEPGSAYGSFDTNKTIRIFSSFAEAEEYSQKVMAGHTYHQRMQFLEILRRQLYNDKLSQDGKWPPLKKIITVISATLK